MNSRLIMLWLVPVLMLASCEEDLRRADGYGNFETEEVMVSAEANGRLIMFTVEEGQSLAAGQVVGIVDTMPLYLKKQQLLASINAVRGKTQNITVQEQVYLEQKKNLLREKKRIEKLLEDGAATTKQLDDINGQIAVVESQMQAHVTSLSTANSGISKEIPPLLAQITQLDDQIARSRIVNPIEGQVLTTFAEPSEIAAAGRPLYKIADTRDMFLRVYVDGNQLSEVALGQEVNVGIDGPEGINYNRKGKVSWIASKAEFTPKTIQTREDRVNLVYAVKVKVPNDGSLKIGMPGEVMFGDPELQTEN